MKLRSIFSTSAGMSRRRDSEECSVPKSSMAMKTPSCLISSSSRMTSCLALIITLSVISMHRCGGIDAGRLPAPGGALR